MFDNSLEAGIPAVKFADPELMRKLDLPNAPIPGMPLTQGSQMAPMAALTPETAVEDSNMFNFSPTDGSVPRAVPPVIPQAASHTTAPSQTLATPNATPNAGAGAENPEQETPETFKQKMSMPSVDGPELAFVNAYAGLSACQRKIVDDMASKLKFADLFQNHRFKIKYDVYPKQLRLTLISMNQGEQEAFWGLFRDTKGCKFEIDVLMDLYRCAYTITQINDSDLPPGMQQRLDLLRGFDASFIRVMANFSTLFEIAKMKILYSNFLTIQGV